MILLDMSKHGKHMVDTKDTTRGSGGLYQQGGVQAGDKVIYYPKNRLPLTVTNTSKDC